MKAKKRAAPAFRVVHGDFVIQATDALDKGSAHLIIADPPYNIGMVYDAYSDDKTFDQYMEWTNVWLTAAMRALHQHGSLWIFMSDELVSDVDVLCRRTFKLNRRSWVVWYYTFGVSSPSNFARSHTHLLYYTKTKTKFTFNADSVRVPSARQLVYNDKRQNPSGKMPDNVWVLLRDQLEPLFVPDRDTWLQSRVCGTFHERKDHSPNQLPLPLVERIILSCSNPGQLVVDPFVGTGTTGVAAIRHGRRFFGMDISQTCVEQSLARISLEGKTNVS